MKTVTSTTLLHGLLDGDNTDAWKRFTERYVPMVVSYARKLGLNDGDAEDVGQEAVMAFARTYGKGGYDASKGRLRNWLFRVAYNKTVDVFRRRAKENVVSALPYGTRVVQSIPSREVMEEKWEDEWKRFVLRACLTEAAEHVQKKTYQAFELYVLHQWPVEAVAEHLHMSENAVYIAKNRVVSQTRALRSKMEETW